MPGRNGHRQNQADDMQPHDQQPSGVGPETSPIDGSLQDLETAMIPASVRQLIAGLEQSETFRDVYTVFDGAKEFLTDLETVNDSTRWIGEFGFMVSSQRDLGAIQENLELCDKLQLTCAPQLHQVLEIPDKTVVLVLRLPGAGGETPEAFDQQAGVSADVRDRYLENIEKLAAEGHMNSTCASPEHWMQHPATGDIVLANWADLAPIDNDGTGDLLEAVRKYTG